MISFYKHRPLVACLHLFFMALFCLGLVMAEKPSKQKITSGMKGVAFTNTLQSLVPDSDPIIPKAYLPVIQVDLDENPELNPEVYDAVPSLPLSSL